MDLPAVESVKTTNVVFLEKSRFSDQATNEQKFSYTTTNSIKLSPTDCCVLLCAVMFAPDTKSDAPEVLFRESGSPAQSLPT